MLTDAVRLAPSLRRHMIGEAEREEGERERGRERERRIKTAGLSCRMAGEEGREILGVQSEGERRIKTEGLSRCRMAGGEGREILSLQSASTCGIMSSE
jgi:ribosomal protein L34